MLKFVWKDGAGAKFNSTYEKLLRALSLPKAAKDDLPLEEDQIDDSKENNTQAANPDEEEDEA